MSLAPMNRNRSLYIQIQTLPRACTTSGKKLMILYAKQPMKSPFELKDNSIVSPNRFRSTPYYLHYMPVGRVIQTVTNSFLNGNTKH